MALVVSAIAALSVRAQATLTMAIDVDVSGNTATSIGSIQNCASISSGDSIDVDITIQSIPPWNDANGDGEPEFSDTGGLLGYQFILRYDPAVLEVTALEDILMIAANGATPIELSEAPPDSDGRLEVAASDFGSDTPEDGDGVLARVTFRAVGNGQSDLNFEQPGVADTGNHAYQLTTKNAAIAVGRSCSAPAPPSNGDGSNGSGGGGSDGSGNGGGGDGAGDGDGAGGGDGGGDGDGNGGSAATATAEATAGTGAGGDTDGTPTGTPTDGDSGDEDSNSDDDDGDSGLSTLAWIGIALGVSAGLGAAAAGGWYWWRQRRAP